MPAVSMAIGIAVAPVIPHAGIIMTSLIVCILMAWLLHRWALVQSMAVLLCFFLMGMLVGQRAASGHYLSSAFPTDFRKKALLAVAGGYYPEHLGLCLLDGTVNECGPFGYDD